MSEIERCESRFWEAVRSFYAPGRACNAAEAARVVDALGEYRAAVESEAVSRYRDLETRARVPVPAGGV